MHFKLQTLSNQCKTKKTNNCTLYTLREIIYICLQINKIYTMSLKKQFLKSKDVCKVTFAISAEEANGADTVHVVGEFNNWNESQDSLKKFKNGNFKVTLNLESEKEYQFKYLVNGETWINDTEADSYAQNSFSGENSVVNTGK